MEDSEVDIGVTLREIDEGDLRCFSNEGIISAGFGCEFFQ
jgi:hypothetical protein